jgi:hypothetical protein
VAAQGDDSTTDRVLAIGLILAIAGAVLQALSHMVNVFVFDGEHFNLDAEADSNAWAWASSVATFTCAFIAAVLALLARTNAGRLWFLAGVLAFFSVDDLVKIHEGLGTRVRERIFDLPTGWGRLAWPAIFFPLLAAVFLLLWGLAREAPERAGLWIQVGLGLLVFAVGLELLSAPWYIEGHSPHSVPGATEVAIEEGAELAGWILIATGLTPVLLQRARSAA